MSTPPSTATNQSASEPTVPKASRNCSKCNQPLADAQDWCLNCGTGTGGALGGGPGWRTVGAILLATVLLIAGASVAAYAALEKKSPPKPIALAKAPSTPGSVTPTTPGVTTPGSTPIPSTPSVGGETTPPKIPLQTPTPKSSGEDTEANEALFPPEGTKEASKSKAEKQVKEAGEATEGKEKTGGSEEEGAQGKGGKEAPSPILLDTDAASTYNPYSYPAALFGDPSLAIDGEAGTAWTAQVQATSAPKMAEGLLLDLKEPQKLGSVKIKTPTVGATIEVYGTNSHPLPGSITDPTWKRLVGLKVLKKKNSGFPLKTKGKTYRYVLLWLAAAPPSSTAASPGSVSIDEFELFPPVSA